MAQRLWIGVLVVLLATGIGIVRFHQQRAAWSPDGVFYLRMLLEARGATPEGAREEATAFVRRQVGGDSRDYSAHPPDYLVSQYALFKNRPLYPRAASLLYPRFGPDALRVVSVIAYVAAGLVMYMICLRFVVPWVAGIGAAALALQPPVLYLSTAALTDELALAVWIATFGGLLVYLQTERLQWLGACLAAMCVMTFTRPAFHLPLGAAIAAVLYTGGTQRTSTVRAAIGIAIVAAAFFGYSALVHGPSVGAQLQWEYGWQSAIHGPFTGHGFARWLAFAAVKGAVEALLVPFYSLNAIFTCALAATGIVACRRTVVVPLAVGAGAAAVLALLANPVDVQRIVTIPVTPVFVLLATIGLGTLTSYANTSPGLASSRRR